MKLQVRHIFNEQEASRLTSEQIAEITKRQFMQQLSEHMIKTVTVNEEYENRIDGKVFSAEIIYMPQEQWSKVLGMLKSLRLLYTRNPEAENILNQLVDEIKNF